MSCRRTHGHGFWRAKPSISLRPAFVLFLANQQCGEIIRWILRNGGMWLAVLGAVDFATPKLQRPLKVEWRYHLTLVFRPQAIATIRFASH